MEKRFKLLQVVGMHKRYRAWAVRLLVGDVEDISAVDLAQVGTIGTEYMVLMTDLAGDDADKQVEFLGNGPVPEQDANGVPLFRNNSSYINDGSGRRKSDQWWLDNGDESWRVGQLDAKYHSIPEKELLPAVVLKRLIRNGWNPNWEFIRQESRSTLVPQSDSAHDNSIRETRFFFLFETNLDAQSAKTELQAIVDKWTTVGGFNDMIECPDGDFSEKMVIVRTNRDFRDVDELLSVEQEFERVAKRHRGSYDGNELPVTK